MQDLGRKIVEYTAAYYQIAEADLVSRSRYRHHAWPRQCAYLLCYELGARSYSDVARTFGGRNHKTIITGIDAVKRRKDLREQAFIAAASAFFKKHRGA